ncbi:Fanconi anemia group F protein [Oxyura jamaicensis]|uniref:Fanconi anemia group F protein n=1 Tax=Oxyura jamaicensis TaxID=8884 RepID=UPI0015A59589|nr:Fanconi anemia group F protein [Oxyura jamaicensis]
MEAVLGQVAQLPALLAVCRSALVRAWDPPTLERALDWGRYFQHLHDRLRARPRLRHAVGQRLRRARPGAPPAFGQLGRCAELLGLALLENRALPPAACRRLLQRLLQPPAARPGRLALLARRKAASRLLEPLRSSPPPSPGGPEPRLAAEAGLLLGRLRDEPPGDPRWLGGVLQQLPRPRAFRVVAAALLLLRQGGGPQQEEEAEAVPLLSWLLEDAERFAAFCHQLPGCLLASLAAHYSQISKRYLDILTGWGSSLLYDPLQGQWVKSCPDETELSWEELRERFSCLCKGSVLLRGQTQAALKLLKARDGDFQVRGLSVWTDLLLEVEENLRKQSIDT